MKTANELLGHIQRHAYNLSATLPDGFLKEVAPSKQGDPNWTVCWEALGENDREFSQILARLQTDFPIVDWDGVPSN